MPAARKAAVDEDLAARSLSDISAADFLTALNRQGLVGHMRVWPEKKKYELYIEPEDFSKFNFGRLIDIIRGEKKKTELEPGPWDFAIRWPEVVAADPSPQPSLSAVARLGSTLEARLRAIEQRLGL